MASTTILAGDLGGTKTDLAVFSAEQGPQVPIAEASFRSREFANIEAIINTFLARHDFRIDAAFLGVAGPVAEGRAKITNLDWQLSADRIRTSCKLGQVVLVNDLVAIANGLPYLRAADLYVINQGKTVADGPLAIIAPGTGLGEAFLVRSGGRLQAFPSEGGHTDFAPTNSTEGELLSFLRQRFNHVSYERLCSGSGLPNIYDFFKQAGTIPAAEWIAAKLAMADDPTPIIVNGALSSERPCGLCRAVLTTFVAVLGAEAGNLALKVLATGGVYLGGGIPPRILNLLTEDYSFMRSFTSKGRMSELLADIPVRVITNPKAALLGAAAYGLQSRVTNGQG
jgi:glucokinase